jgi:hypothetical protein
VRLTKQVPGSGHQAEAVPPHGPRPGAPAGREVHRHIHIRQRPQMLADGVCAAPRRP